MVRYLVIIVVLLGSFPFTAQATTVVFYTQKHLNTLFYPSYIEDLYSDSQPKWQSTDVKKELENQLALLVLADLNDSISKRYDMLQHTSGLEYDVLTTDTLLYLSVYQSLMAEKGKQWLFGGRLDDDIGAPSVFIQQNIKQHFLHNTLHQLVAQLQPKSEQYQGLYKRLYRYYNSYYKPAPKLYSSALLKPEQVIPYQSLIYRLQISGELNVKEALYFLKNKTGLYHRELVDVVKQFQARHGLVVDGIVGKKTLFWLNMSPIERVRIMALNIQRLRLWENKDPRLVIVNIPSYEMSYWLEGKLLFKSKVIVGKPERKTPLLTARLDSIVFNPNWTVPTSIMKKDILPKVFNNQDYLLTHNYEVIPSWRSSEVIPLDDIEWDGMTVDNFPYKLRQKSGNTNALGRYKFNTPNRNAIYLHDTPARSLFKTQRRAYSSGCIRVEKASEFARLLMKESHFSNKEYLNYHKLPKTNTVGLAQIISVYTIYQTAWVDDKNTVQFRNDVYKYDEWSKSKN